MRAKPRAPIPRLFGSEVGCTAVRRDARAESDAFAEGLCARRSNGLTPFRRAITQSPSRRRWAPRCPVPSPCCYRHRPNPALSMVVAVRVPRPRESVASTAPLQGRTCSSRPALVSIRSTRFRPTRSKPKAVRPRPITHSESRARLVSKGASRAVYQTRSAVLKRPFYLFDCIVQRLQ